MARAARRAGRAPDSARLLAVSKLHGAQDILTLFEAGQRMFGENYVQEAQGKMAEMTAEGGMTKARFFLRFFVRVAMTSGKRLAPESTSSIILPMVAATLQAR